LKLEALRTTASALTPEMLRPSILSCYKQQALRKQPHAASAKEAYAVTAETRKGGAKRLLIKNHEERQQVWASWASLVADLDVFMYCTVQVWS